MIMNPREFTLVSTATIFGALASAIAFRFFFFSDRNKQSRRPNSPANGVVRKNCSSQSPFDSSKRNGGCSDDKLPLAKKSRSRDPLETKYPYVCHAEVNAILNTNHASAAGQRLYATMFPCNERAKIIIQAGVSEVILCGEKAERFECCIHCFSQTAITGWC